MILVTGGTDKNLDFSPLAKAITTAEIDLEIVLLSGTGSDKLIAFLKEAGISCHGPFDNIDSAAQTALELGHKTAAVSKSGVSVVLSPGCTSFGMFTNEFDRGRKWKEAVCRL